MAIGLIRMPFTSGGTYIIKLGDTITGATSAATGLVRRVDVDAGTWGAPSDAAGTLYLLKKTGTFESENLNVGANSNVATILADPSDNPDDVRFNVADKSHIIIELTDESLYFGSQAIAAADFDNTSNTYLDEITKGRGLGIIISSIAQEGGFGSIGTADISLLNQGMRSDDLDEFPFIENDHVDIYVVFKDDTNLDYNEKVPVFSGIINDYDVSNDSFALEVQDDQKRLKKPVLFDKIDLNDYPNAEEGAIGNPVPLVFGNWRDPQFEQFTMTFTSGSSQINIGDTIKGDDSEATAVVVGVLVSSDTWGAGTAAGTLTLHQLAWNESFSSEDISELLPVPNSNVAHVSGTEIYDMIQTWRSFITAFPSNGLVDIILGKFLHSNETLNHYDYFMLWVGSYGIFMELALESQNASPPHEVWWAQTTYIKAYFRARPTVRHEDDPDDISDYSDAIDDDRTTSVTVGNGSTEKLYLRVKDGSVPLDQEPFEKVGVTEIGVFIHFGGMSESGGTAFVKVMKGTVEVTLAEITTADANTAQEFTLPDGYTIPTSWSEYLLLGFGVVVGGSFSLEIIDMYVFIKDLKLSAQEQIWDVPPRRLRIDVSRPGSNRRTRDF